MKSNLPFITFCLFLAVSCGSKPNDTAVLEHADADQSSMGMETLDLFDKTRNRDVPIVMYYDVESDRQKRTQKVAFLNHGYGGTNTAHSFIAELLVSHGYFVISIQHDLPGDGPLPTTGNLYEARMPIWQRGVQSMRFAMDEVTKVKPHLDFKNLLLVGHSNGGDMAVLFAHKHPAITEMVVSLDNRRMPLPRTTKPRILSLRSYDQPADKGVLPTPEEQQTFGIRILRLADTAHNEMYDGGTEKQKQEIRELIEAFIKEQ